MIMLENHPNDSRVRIDESGKCQTLSSRMGTGGATLGSLFDGIGGFPLVWETYHGKGTARWASEIEEFPIAVTKKHFPEGDEDDTTTDA